MIDSALYHRLVPVARRFQMRRVFLILASLWTLMTVAGLAFWWMKASGTFYSPLSLPVLVAFTFLASLAGIWFALRGDEEFRKTANDIESRYPELDSSLLTAIQQQPVVAHGALGYLQQEVVRKAVYHGYQNPWTKVVPYWHMLFSPLLAASGLLAFMVVCVGQFFSPVVSTPSGTSGTHNEPILSTLSGGFRIEPGNIEIERYDSLMVLARFANDDLPPHADLVYWNSQGEETRLSMAKSLDDPVFGARIGSVSEPLDYAVRFDGQQTDRFTISVFEYPKLNRADAKLVFPEYTGQENKLIQDVRRVSAVQGTRVTWLFSLNKKIKSGRLLGKDGQEFLLLEDPVEENRYLVDMVLNRSMRLKLELVDQQERKNKTPPTLSIQVTGNRIPEIKQLAPGADVEVSPLEELSLAATFWDDFGIEQAGVSFAMVGQAEQEAILASSIEAKKRRTSEHVLAFEELNAEPDQLLTFHFWAEDRDSSGEIRRTVGDIHMVTVRAFESIFRQGQQPPGGQQGDQQGGQQGGQGQQASQLADLQREIVYAIWNLSRREIFDEVSRKFVEDVSIVSQSQAEAIGQIDQMSAEITDPQMTRLAEEIRGHQQATIEHLDLAAANQSAELLSSALATAQAAYQAMLKLRSRESEVTQSQQQQQQQQQGGGGQSRSRQQMQQLQLENDENRYQSEQMAQEQNETTEDRENRQVLSRLRELSRRQNDLNKRVKELQSALEEAETDAEREEIEEQLKRLQEEQQQILRDTEELQERMDRPENQSRMSEEAQQLEQARENARQSSEALSEGDVSRAAAEGTRALRDLQELRDEFQNRTSGQFDQQMQQMRNEARDIEQEQDEISQQMEELDESADRQRQNLADSDSNSEIEERLQKQRTRVETLREEMRKTVEEAEAFEPILAERLYDTYRKTQQESPEEALETTAQSLRQGFVPDARREERRAARNIEQLREGIDEAAEAVLGDETEALRRANRELDRLTNAVENEFQRANPSDAGDSNTGNDPTDPAESREGQSGADDSSQTNPGESTNSKQESRSGQESQTGEDPQSGESQGEEPGRGGKGSDEPGQSNERNQDGNRRPTQESREGQGAPSLTRQGQRDQRGGLGADPEINYDAETWSNPLTGGDYLDWSDRMRDVEEMVADPELRAEAARIRENARSIRRDIKRHSKEPNWDLIRLKVIEPMVELQDHVQEELIRRSGRKSMVPIDRDPVPAEFENAVQKYFEQLGRGE